jgi:hypothetical protein
VSEKIFVLLFVSLINPLNADFIEVPVNDAAIFIHLDGGVLFGTVIVCEDHNVSKLKFLSHSKFSHKLFASFQLFLEFSRANND